MSDDRNPADDAPRFDPVPATEHVSEHAVGHDDEPALVPDSGETAPIESAPVAEAPAEPVPVGDAPVDSAPVANVAAEPEPVAEAPAVSAPAADLPEPEPATPTTSEPITSELAPAGETEGAESVSAPETVAYPAAAFETPAPYVAPAAAAATTAPAAPALPAEASPVAYPAAAFAAPGAPIAEGATVAGVATAGAVAADAPTAVVSNPYVNAPGTYPPAVYNAQSAVVVPVLVPPKKRGNRKLGTLIALLGAVIFAVVYLLVSAVILAFSVPASRLPAVVGDLAASPAFYVPVIFFAIALILLVLIVNRAGWWAYVLGGFIVAVIVYGASILGALLAVQAWNFTAADAATFIRSLVMDPLTLAAAIVAREVPIWIGAWISSRGRKLKAKNAAEREEYDRTVAEVPAPAYPVI